MKVAIGKEIELTRNRECLLLESPQKRESYTLLLCLKGEVYVTIGYHRFQLLPKMLSILPPDQIFSTEAASEDLDVWQLSFSKLFLQKMFAKEDIIDELLLLSPNYPPRFELEHNFDTVLSRFGQIQREFEMENAYYLDIIRLTVIQLLYDYNRACEHCLLNFEKSMNRNYQLTYQFRKLVDEHFLTWRELGQYAASLGITAKHLTEVVKKETNRTALQILHERLLLEAQYLLKHTDCSIKECAYRLGFEAPSYFNRFFKNQTETTPIAFRENP